MNTNDRDDEIEIDLRDIFNLLRKKLWIVILSGLLFAISAGVVSKFVLTPMYTSSTKLYIVNKSQSLSSLSLSDLQLGTQLTKDYMVLVKSRPVTEQVIKNLGLQMKHEELLDIMTLTNPSDTRILDITVEYPDAYLAKQIVDEVAKVSAARIAVIMDIKEPSIVEEGHIATTQTSPNTLKNTIIFGFLGAVMSIAIIIILHLMNDRIETAGDIEKHLGISVIGLIPLQQQGKEDKNGGV